MLLSCPAAGDCLVLTVRIAGNSVEPMWEQQETGEGEPVGDVERVDQQQWYYVGKDNRSVPVGEAGGQTLCYA